MRSVRARRLKEQARINGRDGSVVISHEYKRLKKSYIHPTCAPVVVAHPTKPGAEIDKKKKQPQLVAKILLGK